MTGESVGVAITWTGSLDILGRNAFREIIKENKDKVWLSLAIPMKTIKSQPLLDKDMFEILLKN